MSNATFLAGAAQVAITPLLGTRIGVDFFSHYARHIHDPLYAKALVLQQGEQQLALVVVDICIMPSDLLADIKTRIQRQTGIAYEAIMLSCTHTHGAGDVAGLLGGAVDIAYRTQLPDLIVQAVGLALEKLQPAQIASGSVAVPEHVLCRRYRMRAGYTALNPVTGQPDQVKTNPIGAEEYIDQPAAPVDPAVGFLAVKEQQHGRWIAVLGNYCLHYVGDWDVDTITADYYGAFSRQLQQKLGADDAFVGMMSHGTGGDVNLWDFVNPGRYPTEPFAKTELVAHDLANRVVEALPRVSWQENPALAVQYEELELAVRKPSEAEINAAAQMLREHDLNNLKIDAHGMRIIYAREQLLLQAYSDTHTAAVQAIRIGDLTVGVLGGELFAETGLQLKSQLAGQNYFTICLANTYDGYVPPAHELEQGGYETWRARSSFLAADAEEKLRTTLLALTKKLT